jgi:hypothetical protein
MNTLRGQKCLRYRKYLSSRKNICLLRKIIHWGYIFIYMDNILIFPHRKIIYPGEKIFFLMRKLFMQESQYSSSKEKYFPGGINFDPFSQK